MTSVTDTAPILRVNPGSRFSWGRALAAFLLTIVAALLFVAAFVFGMARLHDGKVMPGVKVAGVSLAGLDRASAEARLRADLPSLSGGSLVVTAGDTTQRISYAELGRDYDLARALDAAFAVGRSGGLTDQVSEQLQSLTRGSSVDIGMSFDRAAVDRLVAEAARNAERPAVDAGIAPTASGYRVTPGSDGRTFDVGAASSAAAEAIDSLSTSDALIRLEPTIVEPQLTTAEAEAAVSRANGIAASPLVLRGGGADHAIPVDALRSWISFTPAAGGLEPSLDPAPLRAAVEDIKKQFGGQTKNASFAFAKKTGGALVVVPAVSGQTLDVDATTDRAMQALTARADGGGSAPVDMALVGSEPDFTTAEAEALLPRFKKVSSWTTYYPVSEKNFFGKNISIPTTKIDGAVVMPGKRFSFWKTVGEVSRRTGYGPGAAIINGKTEPTAALAGGICSCSTTIFNAALRFGLDMGARRNHYYYINRYPVGLDATVFKSGGGSVQDMTFKNDTEYPIIVRGINRRGSVRFDIYSVPNGRQVSFSRPVIRGVVYPRDSIVYTDQLPPGVQKRTETPTRGFRSTVTRTVRDANGVIVHQDTFVSNYARIHGIVLVGRRPGDPKAGTQIFR